MTVFYGVLLLGPAVLVVAYVATGLAPALALISLCSVPLALRLLRIAVKGDIPQDIDALTAQQAVTPLAVLLIVAYVISNWSA